MDCDSLLSVHSVITLAVKFKTVNSATDNCYRETVVMSSKLYSDQAVQQLSEKNGNDRILHEPRTSVCVKLRLHCYSFSATVICRRSVNLVQS